MRRIPPVAWFLALLGAAWGLERGRALPLGLPSVEVRVAAACVVFAAAAVVAGWAIVLFGRRKTTIVPFAEASALVTTGPYRFTRNPLYVALVASLAAFGLLLDSAWYLAGAALLALALDRFVIREEERRLAERFGEAWSGWAARVRRWL